MSEEYESTAHRSRRIDSGERVFERVSDRDLVTITDRLCGSLEYHLMLVAAQAMREVGERRLWPAVVQRRAHLMRLSEPELDEAAALKSAQQQTDGFGDRHFPVPPAEGNPMRPRPGTATCGSERFAACPRSAAGMRLPLHSNPSPVEPTQ